jgi:drug/metabolite transporter (DMT)-like permease
MAVIRGFALDGYTQAFTVTSVGYLTLSSTLGIIVGDVLWLEALRLLGAKHVIVADSLKPFAAAILGRFLLGESLHTLGYLGMLITVFGVGLVALEGQNNNLVSDDSAEISKQPSESSEHVELETDCNGQTQRMEQDLEDDNNVQKSKDILFSRKEYKRGYICAILNVLADSFGSLLTKQHGVGMTTWSINLIRFGFAGVILLCISIGMRIYQKCFITDDVVTMVENQAISATTHIDDTGNTVHNTNKQNEVETKKYHTKWFELPSLTSKGWLQITLGVAFVTFLCPALEKFSLMQIALGLCVALASVGPLYGVFMDWLFKGRMPTLAVFVGATLAIGGVVILCTYGV